MTDLLLGTGQRQLLLGYGWVLILFIIIPAAVLVPVSMGAEDGFSVVPQSLSWKWYENLITDLRWRDALVLSFKLAAVASLLATVAGVLAALGASRASPKLAKTLRLMFVAPMIVPLMVMGVGFYVVFARLHVLGGFLPLALAHSVLILPFAMLPVSARLFSMDVRLEWAAASLGAGPYRTIRRVVLPVLVPSIVTGFAFAFIFSFDEVVIAQFLSGPRLETLPRRMWEGIQMGGLDKTITAVTSAQLLCALVVLALVTLLQMHKKTRVLKKPAIADISPASLDTATIVAPASPSRPLQNRAAPRAGQPKQGVAVRFEKLDKRYGDFTALDQMTLEIAAGEFVSVLGPSGSGKTTILMLVAGFLAPTQGRLLLGEHDISQIPPHKRDIGVVFQNYALFPHLDVRRNVAFPLEVRGVGKSEIERRVNWALERVHMASFAHRRISQLSGGQQQRIALARAIVFEPQALLMDEPLAALDRNLRGDMQNEIRALQRSLGQTIIYVTHDQEEAMNLSDRVAVMNYGRLQQVDTPKNLYMRPANTFVAGFFGEANLFEGVAQGNLFTADGGVRLPIGEQAVSGRSVLCVRPEMILLGDRREGNLATIDGTVVETRFQGSKIRILVQTTLGPVTVVQPVNALDAPPGEGVTLRLSWDRGLGHVMART